MKYIIIPSLLLFFTSCNQKLTNLNYSTGNSDILYRGVEHYIKIGDSNLKIDTIFTDKGSITHIDSNLYIIYPDTTYSNLNLTTIQSGITSTFTFRIKRIPDLILYAQTDTTREAVCVNAKNFREFSFLKTRLLSFDHDLSMKIKSYDITQITKNEKLTFPIDKPHSGPNKANFLAKRARSGDVFIFSNIIVSLTPRSTRPERTMVMKMKDLIYYIN